MARLFILATLLLLKACNHRSTVIAIINESTGNQPVTIRLTEPVGNSCTPYPNSNKLRKVETNK